MIGINILFKREFLYGKELFYLINLQKGYDIMIYRIFDIYKYLEKIKIYVKLEHVNVLENKWIEIFQT